MSIMYFGSFNNYLQFCKIFNSYVHDLTASFLFESSELTDLSSLSSKIKHLKY